MQPNTSQRRPSRRTWWIAAGLLLSALAGVALYLHLRPEGGEPAGARAPAVGAQKPARYRNRALFRGAPAAPREARPTISGHVFGSDGRTLAGATVAASTFEVAGNVLSTVGSVKTDENGRFELSLAEGTYQLSASVDGYGATAATAHTGQSLSLVLPLSGVIEGRVVDERGEPVRRFAIDVLAAVTADVPATPPMFSRVFESPDGTFRIAQLPSWEIVVRATAADFAPSFSPSLIVRSGDVEKVDLTLSKGCPLSGRVVDASGAPLPGVFVDAESVLAAGQVSDLSLEAAAQAQTEDDGSFHLTNVPKGTVSIRGYDGANAVTTASVEVSACEGLSPVKLVMSPGGGLSGVAREASGKAVAGATLTLMHRTIGFVNTRSDAEGRYRFDQVPPGMVRLMLRKGDRVTVSGATIVEGKEAEQDVTLPPEGTGEVRGRVTSGSQPIPGARLMLATQLEDGSIGVYYPITAEDGSFRASALPPGAYIINVESTSTGDGLQVKPEEVATVNLRVDDLPSVKAQQAAAAAPR